MAGFAPVVPLKTARELQIKGALGVYHLLLAHDVVKQGDMYREVYLRDYATGNTITPTIIMDNSVIELGHPVEKEIMAEALNIIPSKAVVLPDELMSSFVTVEKVKKALDEWGDLLRSPSSSEKPSAMVVPQGDDFSSWVWCLEHLAELQPIGWVGIPKNFKEKLGISRVKAIELVKTVMPKHVKIHLLGFSDDLVDDVMAARHPDVRGIDSAVVARLAMRDNRKLSLANPEHCARGDWWDNPGEVNPLTIQNIKTMRKWIF